MSKRIDYKKLVKNIPSSVEVAKGVTYEVLYSDTIISGEDVLGETRPTDKQIVLKNGQPNRELVLTTWHEAIHAFALEHDVPLTESEVRKFENAFPYFYRFFKQLNGE